MGFLGDSVKYGPGGALVKKVVGGAIRAGVHAYQNKRNQEAVGRGDKPASAIYAKTGNAASSMNGPAIGMGMNRKSPWGQF